MSSYSNRVKNGVKLLSGAAVLSLGLMAGPVTAAEGPGHSGRTSADVLQILPQPYVVHPVKQGIASPGLVRRGITDLN